MLGCEPRTVYNYIDNYPSVKEARESVREKRHDYVENALMNRIDIGDTTAIIFYLKTQCKARGYVERQEIDLNVDFTRLSDEDLQRIIET